MTEEVSLDAILASEELSADVSNVVMHKSFRQYLMSANPSLMLYITKKFDRICEIIFDERHKDTHEIRPYLAILECSVIAVKRTLITSTKYVNYILEYPRMIKVYKLPSIYIFFNSLPYFILDTSNELLPFFASGEFFESIVQNCDIQEAFTFMKGCLNSKAKSFRNFFHQINLPALLIMYVNGSSGMNLNVIKLFEQIVDDYSRQCAIAVVNSNIISKLIESAFLLNCSQLIDFLNFLYIQSYKNKTIPEWFTIEFLVDDRIPEVCDYLMGTTTFDSMCKASANIIITYLSERHQQFPKVISVTEKFIKDIFKNPTNSFLHNTALKFLESVKRFPDSFTNVIKNTNICQLIVDAYKRRNTDVTCCYWGVLRKISEMINEPIGVSLSEWKSVVDSNKKIEKIISTPSKYKITEKSSDYIRNSAKVQKRSKFNLRLPNSSEIFAVVVILLAYLLYYINNKEK
ncbi:hypothetical protein TVAG_130080 [Trichomonas vaginalis G3]|uniref:Uncharacterized protein n=1 Tax=Trichomonas vaginalis (strain ATCC PRA-98 / G3) TaxID=412133 RepID=A2DIA4_TRIV3|nr:hypothetical protein TVAGG3_0711920 [Trichomonas vaginalis G3]EAY19900.1 hypothetical protein TVAG_130080 [Trichomonas vaginalis G3]KAI5509966.1 hypothetical protein TVAGG3_0711920 [Trichomonas vaginalis G3]|eukprot:XP_001580886.1 hypothetical protein [Trichomonas vaginalis G3]